MTSAKFSPAARTAMRTSPRSGCGAALSRTARTSGPPALVIQTARIGAPFLRRSPSIVPSAVRQSLGRAPGQCSTDVVHDAPDQRTVSVVAQRVRRGSRLAEELVGE